MRRGAFANVLASWLQKYPGLDAAKTVPTKVGVLPDVRIDTQRPSEDVGLFQLSNGDQWGPSTRHQIVDALGELYEILLPTCDRPTKV